MIFKRYAKNAILQEKINTLENRLEAATILLEGIAEGNFIRIDEVLQKHNADAKSIAFFDTLQRISHTFLAYREAEQQRKWVSEGMSKFMTIIGGSTTDNHQFYDTFLKLLVEYTAANQGGIFLLNDQDDDDPFLELTSSYAFGKKKYVEKRVDMGQGLLGQCFLDRETTFFSEVPHSYTTITSGLGEATPRFLLLIPIKFNNVVLGVIELAYFKKPEKYQIEFAEKITENMASVTLNLRHAKRAQILFDESVQKAKALQEQEEILRQNVEELVATQEEMKRHQQEVDRQSALLKFIVDNIPFPIFVKDEMGRYALVNNAETRLFNMDEKDVLGKDDSHFVKSAKEWDVIRESDHHVLSLNHPLELPLQHFTTSNGNTHLFKTTKIPFLNPVTGEKNILGVSLDLTEKLTLETDLKAERTINENHTLLNITGRQRMLSQKIGFYCEALVRGKKQHASLLRNAIELHEHTMQIIRYGGMPMGIHCDRPLNPLTQKLIPHMNRIQNLWETYKTAAENILYFTSSDYSPLSSKAETEKNIELIESLGEKLLNANNDLIEAHLEATQTQLARAV